MDPFKLPTFPAEEARSFLLERTRRSAPPTAESKAIDELTKELGYLLPTGKTRFPRTVWVHRVRLALTVRDETHCNPYKHQEVRI